jgi:hypothetical protein
MNASVTDLASPAPYPERGAEQQAAVRRKALPIAVCGLICGLAGIAILLAKRVDEAHPPAILAVNLSFCAMMMGVGILFYARGTSGTRVAAIICVLAIVTGFAGPLVFAGQTLTYRKAAEGHELGNVAAIANAAREYAVAHDGVYPADLAMMLKDGMIAPAILHSPYAATPLADVAELGKLTVADDVAKYVEAHSDYQYFGGDLRLKKEMDQDTFGKIVVATAREPIMRINIAVGFADGSSEFTSLDEAEEVVKGANAARTKLGFGAMEPPGSVSKAEQVDNMK